MKYAVTALLFSGLSLSPALALAENNNDFANDINATSLGTRMSNAFEDDRGIISSREIEQRRLENQRNVAERESYWADRDAEVRRTATLEEKTGYKRNHVTTKRRHLDEKRQAEETRSAAMESTSNTAAVATGAAVGLNAGDQSGKAADVELTRVIRQDIMKQDLSMDAKNIKIITINGVVTLKGHVNNRVEKQAVSNTASLHAGAAQVRDELVITE